MVNGEFVSVLHNSDTRVKIIGKIINPLYDSIKRAIKGTIEIPSNYPELSAIQNIQEVSIGTFSDEVEVSGRHKGRNYMKIAISMKPDHLALLSEERGACSWDDGCGIRANQSYDEWLREMVRSAAELLIQQAGGGTEKETLIEPLMRKFN